MKGVLAGIRSLVLGETWTIPAGVAMTLGISVLLRAALPPSTWSTLGGFAVAGLALITLLLSLAVGR
jgi:hypothetical protein